MKDLDEDDICWNYRSLLFNLIALVGIFEMHAVLLIVLFVVSYRASLAFEAASLILSLHIDLLNSCILTLLILLYPFENTESYYDFFE